MGLDRRRSRPRRDVPLSNWCATQRHASLRTPKPKPIAKYCLRARPHYHHRRHFQQRYSHLGPAGGQPMSTRGRFERNRSRACFCPRTQTSCALARLNALSLVCVAEDVVNGIREFVESKYVCLRRDPGLTVKEAGYLLMSSFASSRFSSGSRKGFVVAGAPLMACDISLAASWEVSRVRRHSPRAPGG